MSGGGGKGGKQETQVRLDPRLEEGAAKAVAGALMAAGLDYTPNRGATIAAFTPQQLAAFQGADQAASAFGLPTGGGSPMPTPETNSMGIQGYSTGGIYDENLAKSVSPEQQAERQGILDYYSKSGQQISKMGPAPRAKGGK